MLADAARFALGTFTAIPVRPPLLTRPMAGAGLLLAPLAVLPLGALVGLVLWGGRELSLAPFAVATAAIAVLALGSRAFHLDGLADTADGLTASYDRERALAVMDTGDVGPAGAAALVLTLGVQVGAVTHLLGLDWGPLLVGALVCVSRLVPASMSLPDFPAARATGLGAATSGSVRPVLLAAAWLLATGLLTLAFVAADEHWTRGPACGAVALIVTALLIHRAVRRLGGVTGDVFGAGIELSLALMLLAAT